MYGDPRRAASLSPWQASAENESNVVNTPSTSVTSPGGNVRPSLPAARRRSRLTVLTGVLGELLLTLGAVLLLYTAWELWWTNLDAHRVQSSVVDELTQEFTGGAGGRTVNAENGGDVRPGEAFGILYVPRFGEDYARPIAEGVDAEVLNTIGIGRYPGTQWPGEEGNFALAGHRQTHGQVFWDMDKLIPGDRLYVQTRQGYFTYRHTHTEIVEPSASTVLLPVPHHPGLEPSVPTLTLTTCHPPFTTKMRMVAYAELESWTPPVVGVPAEIAAAVSHGLD